MSDHATIVDIAAALGISKRAAEVRATRDAWPYQEAPCRGGRRRLYALADLPNAVREPVQAYLLEQAIRAPHGVLPAATPNVAVATPDVAPAFAAPTTEAQRAERDARQAVEREIVRLMADAGCSKAAAMTTLLTHARAGRLERGVDAALRRARDPRGRRPSGEDAGYPSIRSLKRYLAAADKTPKRRQKVFSIKPWHADAVALRRRPQGSTLAWVVAELAGRGHAVSYGQVRRFFTDQFSQLDQARHTGSQLRSQRFYQHRTADGLAPADEVHADGWNTHFSAPHPATGEFVTYEVWHFHDVATRYVTPPGIGLTEQFEVVAKGLENFMRVFGRPLIVQTDSTRVVKGSDRFTQAVNSLEERIGCTIVHPQAVGNSQANGICENFNTSWLDKRARELATYQNPGQMDDLSYKRVRKLTAAMVRAANAGDIEQARKRHAEAERMGHGRVFVSHQEAVEWILGVVAAYNDRPHRALKRVRGDDGRLRHQTPREALVEHAGHGWEPVAVDEDALIDLFRPHKVVRVTRETVSPYGGMRYRNPEVLGHWNGKEVVVAYDIHDWRTVWVKTLSGELICEAEFVAATGYRAQSAYDSAEEKRARAQIRSLENKQKRVAERRLGGQVIEFNGDGLIPLRDAIDLPAVEIQREQLRDLREVLAEAAPEEVTEPVREMSWEETKMWLYGNAGAAEQEGGEPAPEEVAAP